MQKLRHGIFKAACPMLIKRFPQPTNDVLQNTAIIRQLPAMSLCHDLLSGDLRLYVYVQSDVYHSDMLGVYTPFGMHMRGLLTYNASQHPLSPLNEPFTSTTWCLSIKLKNDINLQHLEIIILEHGYVLIIRKYTLHKEFCCIW